MADVEIKLSVPEGMVGRLKGLLANFNSVNRGFGEVRMEEYRNEIVARPKKEKE